MGDPTAVTTLVSGVLGTVHDEDADAAGRLGSRTAHVDRVHSSPAEMAARARRFDHVAPDLAALAEQLARPS